MTVVKYGLRVCVVCFICFLMSACSFSDPTEPKLPTPKGTPIEEGTDQTEESTNDILSTGFCHGNELLCLPEMTPELIGRAGGKVLGGTFTNGAFNSTSKGGIAFNLKVNTSQPLRIEFEIENDIPNWRNGESNGGKVSLASLRQSGGNYYFSFQRMYGSYRGGGVFRAILADRPNLLEQGAAFLITTSDLAGQYSMANWGNEAHRFEITIQGNACQLNIDSYRSRSASAPYDIGGTKNVSFVLGNRGLEQLGMGQGAKTTFTRLKVTN